MMNEENKTQTITDSQLTSRTDERVSGYCIQKAERLSTAIHRVTDFLSDNEPVKFELRKASLKLLKDISGITASVGILGGVNRTDIFADFNHIIALCSVALASGQYSVMNFEIIRNEYLNLRGYIEEHSAKRLALLHEELGLPQRPDSIIDSTRLLGDTATNVLYKGHDVSKSYRMSDSHIYAQAVQPAVQFRHQSKNDQQKSVSNSRNIQDNVSQKRQELIVQFLKKIGPSSIADIAKVVPGCVEKTVQRELAKMIENGLIRRDGERRWSRYSLSR